MTQQTDPLFTCGGGLPCDHNGTKQTWRDALRKLAEAANGAYWISATELIIDGFGNEEALYVEAVKPSKVIELLDAIEAQAKPAKSSVAFSDQVIETFVSINGPASDGVMDSLRLAAAHVYAHPAQSKP